MQAPQHTMNVWVTLASGEEVMAYWLDGKWWVGVENDPVDIVLTEPVVSWREVT